MVWFIPFLFGWHGLGEAPGIHLDPSGSAAQLFSCFFSPAPIIPLGFCPPWFPPCLYSSHSAQALRWPCLSAVCATRHRLCADVVGGVAGTEPIGMGPNKSRLPPEIKYGVGIARTGTASAQSKTPVLGEGTQEKGLLWQGPL